MSDMQYFCQQFGFSGNVGEFLWFLHRVVCPSTCRSTSQRHLQHIHQQLRLHSRNYNGELNAEPCWGTETMYYYYLCAASRLLIILNSDALFIFLGIESGA